MTAPLFRFGLEMGIEGRNWGIAPRFNIAHIHPMADRTCKPDPDFKRLWRTLLPGTPFPACGTDEEPGTAIGGTGETADHSPNDSAPNRERLPDRR